MFKISRNEKCWCGSGKKYKVCHERSDEKNLGEYASNGYIIPDKSLILKAEQIEGIKESAKLSVKIMDELDKFIEEGITTEDINKFVHKMTVDAGAYPAPLDYEGFPKSVCTSLNNVVCHGIPDGTVLKSGDILNVDVTTILNGYYSDMSRMYLIGDVSDEAKRLVEVTKECMLAGIKAVSPYTPVSEIGNAINEITDREGYSIIRALSGHGVGLEFHNEPIIEHFRTDKKSMIMVPGMVFTVEPMINEGTFECEVLDDGWTVVTKDGKLSAQWEHTVLVTETGVEIITE
jgi:methionyl aminopeptidase